MQTAILNLAKAAHTTDIQERIDIAISFKPFLTYLEERKKNEQTVKAHFFQFVLDQFYQVPELQSPLTLDDTGKYDKLLELVYATLSSPVHDENNMQWALCAPLSPIIFYGTDAVYRLLYNEHDGTIKDSIIENEKEVAHKKRPHMMFAFILQKLYGFDLGIRLEMTRCLTDEKTGLQKFFRFNIDPRFINIITKAKLPELNFEKVQQWMHEPDGLQKMNEVLPLSMFRFEGFSVITLTDVTEQFSLETIKNLILNRSTFKADEYYNNVISSLKTLAESNDVEFGLLPILKVNDKLVFNESTCLQSKLVEAAKNHGMAESMYLAVAEHYFKNPKLLLFKTITPEDESKQIFLKLLKQDGVSAYGLIPIFYNSTLAGVLEAYSKKQEVLNEAVLSRLEPAIPLMAQVLENNIEEFNLKIENIIREKYTSLQPAVLWKFNEVAWHYLKNSFVNKNSAPQIETIFFNDVHPLYGAIDIRNSTIERNNALRKDLENQFHILLETLIAVKEKVNLSLIDEVIFKCRKKLAAIVDSYSGNEELNANDFLENEVTPLLSHFIKVNPEAAPIIDVYTKSVDETKGAAFENRRQLELSMQMITSSVNSYLERFNSDAGNSYPCYFEKFRSDGVEYDIYIGQSIAPDKPFDTLYLKNLRLWQLSSMAAIAKITHALLPQLPRQLQTTQLIFAHSNTIDICFRNDERRFDVEGAYNIRYQIIKKRIDKVRIKDTNERLTQPGKIAIIYFSNKEADEYTKYIQYLQEQHTLTDDFEELELEELQGVRGLRALRVGVMLD